jgi:dolichol-phosphate mannosyltransferase
VRALVVIPTYEEALNVAEVLRRVRAAVPTVDVLVVDAQSPDGTADVARTVADEIGRIDVLHTARAGLGRAYRAGFAVGLERDYEVLVEMDADLSHDPAALPELLAPLDDRADVVIGSRYVPGGSIPNWSFHRRALSRYGNRYASHVLGLGVRDATSGYRAYRSEWVRRLDPSSVTAEGYGFQIEMTYRLGQLGARIVEVPIAFTDRVRGESKMSGRIVFEAAALVSWWGLRDRVLPRNRRARA